jgi:4-hydroxy-tetrahydrodipicolinate reductase
MRVAIVGYGKMGHEIETRLNQRGHTPVVAPRGSFPADCPVGIDFSRADAVADNVARALAANARYVLGTTGWSGDLAAIRQRVEAAGGALVYAANFSLGVNLYYRVVRAAAALLAPFPDYDPYVLERHHRQKQDAPSGTAKILAGIVEAAKGIRSRPVSELDGALPEAAFHVSSLRAGGIVGDHTVGFDSGGDEILIEHRARSRGGFALGAVLAAEWIVGRQGFFGFEDILDDLAQRKP